MLPGPPELKDFPERFEALVNRITHGNLSEFSRRSGIPDSTLKMYLPGEKPSRPGLAHLLKIAKGAGLSLDELVYGPREERPAASLTPKDQLEVLVDCLRAGHGLADISASNRRKYLQRLHHVEALIRRLVTDVEEYLAELRTDACQDS